MSETVTLNARGFYEFKRTGLIVLFFNDTEGVVISGGTGSYGQGHVSNKWWPCDHSYWKRLDDYPLTLRIQGHDQIAHTPIEEVVTESRKITV